MRQQRTGWTDRVRKVYLRRCTEGKEDDAVTRALSTEWRRAAISDELWRRYQAHPEKSLAISAVGRAVARGDLVRPSVCSRCGKVCFPDGHHHSYAREDWLSVEWLCRSCHRTIHRR